MDNLPKPYSLTLCLKQKPFSLGKDNQILFLRAWDPVIPPLERTHNLRTSTFMCRNGTLSAHLNLKTCIEVDKTSSTVIEVLEEDVLQSFPRDHRMA